MKTKISLIILVGILGVFALLASGCYTQLQAVRSAGEGEEGYASAQQVQDSSYDAESEQGYTEHDGCCDDNSRPRVGFDYYYPSSFWPSSAFGIAYSNPWSYDYYWTYNPFNYYSVPYYGYSSYWYAPYYSSPYYYGYYYSNGGSNLNHGRRYDGSVRGNDRSTSTSGTGYNPPTTTGTRYDLPAGTSMNRTAAPSSSRSTPVVRNNSRRQSDNRGYTRRDSRTPDRSYDAGKRGSISRDSNRGAERRRDTQPQYRPPETRTQQPAYQPPRREERGSAPSYTPPPAPPPQRSSPPPSSNSGSRRNDSNDRGSGSSGGRRP